MSRVLASDVHLTTATHGVVHLQAGTREADVPQWVRDERAPRLVPPVPARIEDSDEPLLGDHVWVDAEE
jgi:hypothetical protein